MGSRSAQRQKAAGTAMKSSRSMAAAKTRRRSAAASGPGVAKSRESRDRMSWKGYWLSRPSTSQSARAIW